MVRYPGLSIYGNVTIIKFFLIPKYINVCSILPTPKELLKELNEILFKFLWKEVDKVTRASVINEYDKNFSPRMCAKRRSASCKKRREFWRETHTPLWLLIGRIIFLTREKTSFAILIGRIIFFTCENHSSLL